MTSNKKTLFFQLPIGRVVAGGLPHSGKHLRLPFQHFPEPRVASLQAEHAGLGPHPIRLTEGVLHGGHGNVEA